MVRFPALRAGYLIRLVFLVSAALLFSASAPANAAFPGANGKIAFARNVRPPGACCFTGNEIFTMNADGSGQTNVTNDANTKGDYYPAWSPAGSKIAFGKRPFSIDPEGGKSYAASDIYLMNPDGSEQ